MLIKNTNKRPQQSNKKKTTENNTKKQEKANYKPKKPNLNTERVGVGIYIQINLKTVGESSKTLTPTGGSNVKHGETQQSEYYTL